MRINNLWIEKLRNILLGIFLLFFAQLTLPILFEWKITPKFWCIVLAIIFYFSLVDFKNPEKLARNAFILILSFGTVIALIRPVQYALDEESHLENAIGISDSFLFEYSNETISDYDSVFLHDGIRNQANFRGDDYWYNVEHRPSEIAGVPKSFDNPSFLPGAIGWNIGRLISNKVYISYYIGRIVHVLAYALLVFFSIKISKVYQKMLYLMGTLPSALYVVSGYHYDYLYYGASLILVALLTNVLAKQEKVTSKFILNFQGLVLLFVFSKFPFVLLGTLLTFLPKEYFVSKKVRILGIVSFFPVMLFALIYSGILNIFNFSGSVTGESPGLAYFLKHPLPIIRTMLSAPEAILENFIRRPLQYVSHDSGILFTATTLIVLLVLFALILCTRITVPKIWGTYTVFLMLGITFLMVYAITGDPRVYNPGNISVGGVQGRYYYFMICLIPLFLGNWLNYFIPVPQPSEEEDRKLTIVMQYLLSFLVIFTVSIGFYTQI
ncbi:TPA: DUF2142 domain-containing protein [Streptococcus suis]